jgi:predicted Zn-ribbon and HTH transcriptional regulator
MLNQLLALLENRDNGLSLAEISREMNAQPTAVKSMIYLLIRKGKILKVGPDNKVCSTCGLEAQCNLLATRGKRYVSAFHSKTFLAPLPESEELISEIQS